MARLVPTVIGSRKDVFDRLTELGMIDDVLRIRNALGTQFLGITIEETLEDGSKRITSYEVIKTELIK